MSLCRQWLTVLLEYIIVFKISKIMFKWTWGEDISRWTSHPQSEQTNTLSLLLECKVLIGRSCESFIARGVTRWDYSDDLPPYLSPKSIVRWP